MAILLSLAIFLIIYFIFKGHQNTQSVVLNHVEIGEKRRITPLRILHISDIHLENISISPETLYSLLKDQPIDLIALTGDYMDRKRSIPKLIPYLKKLNKLKPTYGSFAVFGNHDYVLKGDYFNQLKEILNSNGFTTLQNENAKIYAGDRLVNIIGIDDYSTNRSNVTRSFKGMDNGYNLVFTHDPNIVLSMKDNHFDYLLAGHFHGGQIHWPKPYHLIKMGKLVRMNMVKGLHQYKGRPFYISEGLGQTGVNIRVGSRPEITIHSVYINQEGKENTTTKAG